MERRTFLGTVAASSAAASLASTRAALAAAPGAPIPNERLPEATIAELQAEMAAGRLTSRRLVEFYTRRIADLDQRGPRLGHVLEVNPEARERLNRSTPEGGPGRASPELLKALKTLLREDK